MANLASNSTGNFTTAATWSLLDSTSFLDSETNNTNTTTSFVSSSTFVPGAITVDGIGIKIQSRSASPTGTFEVRLFDSTLAAAVAGTTVTINVSDMPAVNTSTNMGFVFMKFSAPVLLAAVNNHTVQVRSSTANQVSVYRDATAANWSRFLRTTTTQAPAAGDGLFVLGEYISAGSNNSFTVTMNETATTQYGELEVSTKGTLTWGTSASTNYYLKLAGDLTVYTDAIYNMGTSGTPMPSTSTALLEFVCSSNVQFGFQVRLGGTVTTFGNALTYDRAYLASDASAAATSLTTDVSTGWLSGDEIAIASTTRTKTECEKKSLTANASGTTLTISAITNAHSGTSPTQAELLNLTRNVKIFSSSVTLQTFVNILGTSVVSMNWTEFYNMGSATALKRGIDVGTTTGSITINRCSMHDFNVASSIGINCNSSTGNNYTITNNVIYNTANIGFVNAGTTGTAYTVDNICCMLTGAAAISLGDLGGTITNICGIGATGAGIAMGDATFASAFGTLTNFLSHSNSTTGISLTNTTGVSNSPLGTLTTCTVWRNNGNGVVINNSFDFIIDGITAFGNLTANISYGGSTGKVYLKNIVSNAGTTLTCPIGVAIVADIKDAYIDSSSFGATTTHATADISVTASNIYPKIYFRNCLFSSSTTFANANNMIEGGFVASARHNQTNGNHRWFKKYGTIQPDSTIFNNSTPSVRMTPSNASFKLFSGIKKIAVPSGQTATITVYLRKSVSGDGSAYNGNQPRLMLLADPATGVTSDTVLATADNTYNGAFKALTATTPAISDNAVYQVYVDCDGTAGWVNIDDWSAQS